jgi:WD40 repeat protein
MQPSLVLPSFFCFSSELEVSMLTAILLSHFLLASADVQGELSVFTLLSQQLRWRIPDAHQGAITVLAFSPDGFSLASGGDDGLVQIWHTDTGELLHTFCHGSPVDLLHWSPNHLLASTSPAHLRVWFV